MRNSQSPSIHSIYSNALPFYLDRVDLKTAAVGGDTFIASFLKQLFKGDLSLQFDASKIAADNLRHLYFESKNLSKTVGAKTFGFGYPMLIDTHENELIVAPLFVWQLSLEPAQTKIDAWVVKFDNQHPVQFNSQAVKYIKEKFDFDYQAQIEKVIENNTISETELASLCSEIIDRFQFTEHRSEGVLLQAPGIDEIGEYTTNGSLHWSGVLGIYPPQHQVVTSDHLKPEDVFIDKGDAKESDPFVYPFLAADPEQVTALEMSVSKALSVVEGVDSLGKSQTILNLLLTLLMQGKKCLIVSERAPALKRIQELLAKAGINQLNFMLTDAMNDKDQLLEYLRLAAKGISREVSLDEKDFQYKKNKFIREKARLDAAYGAINNTIFGDKGWTDTVGLFLSHNKVERKELLTNHLYKNDFQFNSEEHLQLSEGIQKCVPLFAKVKTLHHPLSNINDRVFQQVSIDDGKNYLEDQLNIFIKKARELHHLFIETIAGYKINLAKHFDNYTQNIEQHLFKVDEKILGYSDRLGRDFVDAGPISVQLPSFLYSKKRKKILAAQHDVAKGYKSLKALFEKDPYFDFDFPSAKEGMKINEVVLGLESFKEAFAHWKSKLEGILQEETVRLNSKTAHPNLGVKEEMSLLEFSLDTFLEELNEAKLYQEPLVNKNLTIPKRQKYLESVIDQLETTKLYLKDFAVFYQWQSQWLQIGELGQKVVKALVKVKPKNWNSAFNSWYFYNLLEVNKNESLPTELAQLFNYESSWHELKPLLLSYIEKQWKQRQYNGLKKLRKSNKQSYQALFDRPFLNNKNSSKSLKDILVGGMEEVTDFLPVLFASSHVALNILPKSFQFDMVIFEEANRFSIEPSTEIAKLAKQLSIFGSNDSNGNETSLLQYAIESGVPSSVITNRYETPDQFLAKLDSSEKVFGFDHHCRVENLEGRFHEIDGTNDVEAQQVIRILNQIKQTPQRVYPSVAIVTFTLEQRDLISAYILKLKQQNAVGSEKIRHLERNGMGVFFIEELYGQQFDIVILSCTFGSINLKGKLTKRLSLLNTQEGISYLHLLINMPVQRLYLLHSFTDAEIDIFAGKQWDKGTWLLSHFIKMAEAAQQENKYKYEEEMEIIGKKEKSLEKNVQFVKEIQELLQPYIDSSRFEEQVQWEDIVLPLIIKPVSENGVTIVIHPDGFFADTPCTSGVWEKAHIDKLTRNDFHLIPVWSVNWLSDMAHETRKLASQIIKVQGAVPFQGNQNQEPNTTSGTKQTPIDIDEN
ncbi:MAG: hypothetical protein AAFZ15_30885 [Bacteroidota bacterium]